MRSASQQQGGGSIMSGNNKEDEEDELEALRLAALESLRAKGLPPPVVPIQRLSPKPSNACNNAVFQRHFGNQNLIAIIPVESSSASSSPYQNSSPHHHPLMDSKVKPPLVRSSGRPPLLKNPPVISSVSHSSPVEEKPKPTTKFSRFEDSDSDESDDIEMSFAKSESEEEEFVIEEGDAEDLIIEVEDEIVEEEEPVRVAEHPTDIADLEKDVVVTIITSEVEESEKSLSPITPMSSSNPPLKAVEITREDNLLRDSRNLESSRKFESGDLAKRSPKLSSSNSRSPTVHSRRRSPPRSQRSTPPKLQKSPPRAQRSPPRNQRSPLRVQRSPVRAQRSPVRIQRSPPRVQRSPLRVQRSPTRTQRSPPRTQRSPSRRSPLRSTDRDKPKTKEISKTSSGSDRSGSDEARKVDRSKLPSSLEVTSSRTSDQRRTGENKSRSPTSDRKPLLKRSPARSVPNDRDTRKLVTPSLTETERDRLESRKRKFETAQDHESPMKKEGKIRLRGEVNRKTSPIRLKRKEQKLKKKEPEKIQVRRDEPISMVQDKTDESDVEKKSKKNKRPAKKSKEKSRNGKTLAGNDQDNAPMKLSGSKNDETSDAHLDLRAELQRRRSHRYEEDEEPRSRTPETRRILVLNSPPASTAAAVPPKPSTEPTGVLSKHQRLVSKGQSKKSASDSLAAASKRNGSIKLKRALLATPIEIDQGPETDPLEDRIRQIRAQNELIRKRQREIEADKLQYA